MNPFKKSKNLTAILGSFEKTLADLNTLIAGNLSKIGDNNAKVEALTEETVALATENERAGRVVERIQELVA